jgi:serine/threonine protein kinase/Flp pilus assembly protein TadD
MTSQRELVEQMFEAVLALRPTERDAFLDESCGDDPELRRMVEELLAEDARVGSFLEHSPLDFLDVAAMGLPPDEEITHPVDEDETVYPPITAGRLKPGQVLIDRFVIARFIAKGGMGEVYEAEDHFLQGVRVALKIILPHIADDMALQQRFQQEVLLAREVAHPNLCPIYDIFHSDQPRPGFLFLTMKMLPGETLATRLRGPERISTEEGLAILKQTALGLEAIHHANIVHRDIKPNNLMLDGSGPHVRVWITDFGLARAFEAEPTYPGQIAVAGTPSYIAPELLLGYPPSQASDLYAFGVVLHDGSSVIISPELISSGAPAFCVQLVRGCLDKDPKHRCEAFQEALQSLSPKPRKPWTRRQFMGAAATAACGAGCVTWWKRDSIDDLLHPLPTKRFVALLNWPKPSDSKIAPMLNGALSAIKSELARAEAFDRNLFVISPEDIHQEVPADAHLREICDPLGANLVLAASGVPGSKHLQLILRLVNPLSDRSIREKEVNCSFAEITSLPGKAVQAAARLLNVSRYLQKNERVEPGTQSTEAFTAYQQAESLMKEPNDAGLDAAIEKYKEAIELDPRYALAHAQLGIAYGHLYGERRDPGALDLARGNCRVALTLNPRLVDAHLGLAWVLEQTGDERGALDEFARALALDPSNPRTLVWQGQLYGRLNRWREAEEAFQRVLQERPNYWLAYNELGFVLHGEGKFQKAIGYLRDATVAAPRNSLAWSNLGVEYLQVGDFSEATESLKKSLAVDPAFDQAAQNMSLALRCQGKYEEALPFARRATELNPSDDMNWMELGECYSSLPGRQGEARAAYLEAAKVAEQHLRTDKSNGPGWMLLALYRVKSGSPQEALSLVQKADSLGADDMDSQLYKARILELLGKRDQALATLAACFRRGATTIQVAPVPDMESLRKDPRYLQMARERSAANDADQSPHVEKS